MPIGTGPGGFRSLKVQVLPPKGGLRLEPSVPSASLGAAVHCHACPLKPCLPWAGVTVPMNSLGSKGPRCLRRETPGSLRPAEIGKKSGAQTTLADSRNPSLFSRSHSKGVSLSHPTDHGLCFFLGQRPVTVACLSIHLSPSSQHMNFTRRTALPHAHSMQCGWG